MVESDAHHERMRLFRGFEMSLENVHFVSSEFTLPPLKFEFLLETDLAYGNYGVLLANIGILTASSFALTVGHLRLGFFPFACVIVLAFAFLLNQIDELFSATAISSPETSSLVLLCLYTHLSHLVLSLFLFLKLLMRSSEIKSDVGFSFVCAYWHLVEVVWVMILLTLVGF